MVVTRFASCTAIKGRTAWQSQPGPVIGASRQTELHREPFPSHWSREAQFAECVATAEQPNFHCSTAN